MTGAAQRAVGVFTTEPALKPSRSTPTIRRSSAGRPQGHDRARVTRSKESAQAMSEMRERRDRRLDTPGGAMQSRAAGRRGGLAGGAAEHRPARDAAAPRPGPDAHAAGVRRRWTAISAATSTTNVAVRDPAVHGRDCRAARRWCCSRRACRPRRRCARHSPGGRRSGQPREHHRLCDRCERPARGERHPRYAPRDRGGGQGSHAPADLGRPATTPTSRSCGRSRAPRTCCSSTRRAASPSSPRTPAASWSATPTTSAPGAAAHRRRHAVPLPAHLRAEEPRVRRHVPQHRRQGEAPGRRRLLPQRLPRASA